MSKSYNKKEIKNESIEFRTIASRVLTSEYDTFDDNLKRLLNIIDNTENIKNYIDYCISMYNNFEIENDIKQASDPFAEYYFESFIEKEKEVSYNYQILKYIVDNDICFNQYTYGYSHSRQYNDKIKGFNDKFVLPFINAIDRNYERICVEMGLDEESNYYITNNNGQINIAKDNATINATQNNYSEIDNLVSKVKNNIDNSVDDELKTEIIDNIEGLREELKKEQPRKGIINAIINSLKDILQKIPKGIKLAMSIAEIIRFVSNK